MIRPENFVFDSSYYSINNDDGSNYETFSSVKLLKSPANKEHSIRYGFDYRINKNNYLKFSGSYSLDKSEFLSDLSSKYYANGSLLYDAFENDKSKMVTPEQNYTLYFRHKFSKKGHELSFNSNLYTMKRDNQNTYSSKFIYSDGDVRDVNMLRHLNNEQTAFNTKLKYDLPLSDNFKISAGVQSIYREIHYRYDNSLDNQYFDYTDLRLAGFLQAVYNIKDNLSVMAGIRCEQLEFNIYDTINNSQLNYLPNLSLLHRINKKHSLRLNYKTLLTYPSYHFLTPFVYNGTDSLSYEEAFLSTKNETVCQGHNYYQRDWSETKHSAFRLFVRYVFNAGNKTLKDAEELESLMESEKNVKQRK